LALLTLLLSAGALTVAPASARAQEGLQRRQDGRAGSPSPTLRDGESTGWAVGLGVEVTGGYDSNPAAGADPDQWQAPSGLPEAGIPDGMAPDPMAPDPGRPGPDEPSRGSPYGQVGTRLTAEVGTRWWARARLGWDLRQYLDGNRRSQEWLGLDGGWRSREWMTRLTAEAVRYDDTLIPDDAWTVRTDLALSRWLGEHGLVGVHVESGTRRYDALGLHDAFAGGGPLAGYLSRRVRAGAGVDAQRRWSDVEVVRRTELVPWAAVGYVFDGADLDVRYEAHLRFFDRPQFDGHEHRLRARALIRPWRAPVALVVALAHGRARGDREALRYDRWDASAGLAYVFERQAGSPLPSEATARRQGIAIVEPMGVCFRVRQPGARSVAVVGTFNGWDPEEGVLRPTGNGWFEATVDVPPGRHQYQLLVDGEMVLPEDAPGYVPDGFGGRNALLIVP
jgi:hypothetical protein